MTVAKTAFRCQRCRVIYAPGGVPPLPGAIIEGIEGPFAEVARIVCASCLEQFEALLRPRDPPPAPVH